MSGTIISNGSTRGPIQRTYPVEIEEHIQVCRDPDDDKFLELALSGNADVIVSGDDDLLVLHLFRGIPIPSPDTFPESEVVEP